MGGGGAHRAGGGSERAGNGAGLGRGQDSQGREEVSGCIHALAALARFDCVRLVRPLFCVCFAADEPNVKQSLVLAGDKVPGFLEGTYTLQVRPGWVGAGEAWRVTQARPALACRPIFTPTHTPIPPS